MEKIIVSKANRKAIDALIKSIEGKAKSRIIGNCESIEKEIYCAEKMLKELKIPKTKWEGSTINILPAIPCNSYRYKAYGTYILIQRNEKKWKIVSIFRDKLKTKPWGENAKTILRVSELQRMHQPWTFEV